jgi:hypothetical protein
MTTGPRMPSPAHCKVILIRAISYIQQQSMHHQAAG